MFDGFSVANHDDCLFVGKSGSEYFYTCSVVIVHDVM